MDFGGSRLVSLLPLAPAGGLIYQIAHFLLARLDEGRLDSATVAIITVGRDFEETLKVLNALLYLIYHYSQEKKMKP